MSKLLLALLVLIICFTPPLIFAHSEVTVIEMVEDGFLPTETVVDESSSVIFINKDTKARWPASNVHPTHDIYPDFDPKQPIKPGESWAFKPTKTGSFKYHDHLLPHLRGNLTINPEADSSVKKTQPESKSSKSDSNLFAKVYSWFSNIPSQFKSLFVSGKKENKTSKSQFNIVGFTKAAPQKQFDLLTQTAKAEGSKKIWGYVKQAFTGQSGSSGNIHDLAHLTGKLIFENDGFSGLGVCSADFAFGCYHGFLDTAFAKDLTHLADAEEACLKLGPPNSGPVASCIHGIGHGVASFHATDGIKPALFTCRKLESGSTYCFDGVFMEFFRSAPDSFFKADDPYYPCNSLEKDFGYTYSLACGRNQPSLLMGRFKYSFDDVVSICLNSASKPFKEACFDSLGFTIAGEGNVDNIIGGCSKIADPFFADKCLIAAAGELVFQEVSNWNQKSKTVCSASNVENECLEYVKRLIKEYSRQVKIEFPQKTTSDDMNSYIRNQFKVCYKSDGSDGCYKQLATVLYNQFGLKQVLQVLRESENYPEVYARCHEATHYLSRMEYQTKKSISKVYAQCDSTCHGGCYHGTLEAYLKEKTGQSDFDLKKQFARVCGQQNDYSKPLEFNECLHGLGHAAMFVTDMELRDSLVLCDSLKLQNDKERCFSGVFMENSSSSTSFDHKSVYIKTDDPFYPCNSLEEKYQPLCWQYQSSYFSIISHQDWVKVVDLCLQVPEKYQDKCFRTIGTNQVGFTTSLTTMKQDCDLMPDDNFKNICVSGVVSSLSYRFVGESQKMADFCTLVSNSHKQSCYKQMGTSLLDWDKNTNVAKNECGKITDPDGLAWCQSVI